MKIVINKTNEEKSCLFGNLDVPTVFRFEGEYYLKFKPANDYEKIPKVNNYNTLNLSDYSNETYSVFLGTQLVVPVDATLTIED
jgi:hypothetical protein